MSAHTPQPWEGVLIATLAGASTIIGGLSLFLVRRFKPIPFSICLGLAGGVMTYVTMVEMIPETIFGCIEGLQSIELTKPNPRNPKTMEGLGWLLGTSCVFLGWFLGWFISWAVDSCLENCNLVGELQFDELGNLVKGKGSKTEPEKRPAASNNSSLEESSELSDDALVTSSEVDLAREKADASFVHTGIVTAEELQELLDDNGVWDGEKALEKLVTDEIGFSRWIIKQEKFVDEGDYCAIRLASTNFRRDQSKFLQVGLFTAIALGIHNMPEGMATYTSYMQDANFGYGMAFAIAVHNIPEGIAVAVPVYFGTGSWIKALSLCSISAVAEPVGALVAMGIKNVSQSALTDGIMFGFISGFMLRVALAELFYTGFKYDPTNLVIIKAFCIGMAIMGYSLTLFEFF